MALGCKSQNHSGQGCCFRALLPTGAVGRMAELTNKFGERCNLGTPFLFMFLEGFNQIQPILLSPLSVRCRPRSPIQHKMNLITNIFPTLALFALLATGYAQKAPCRPPVDFPPTHTSGLVRHPDYDPALNTKGCAPHPGPVPSEVTFRAVGAVVSQLTRTHPEWAAWSKARGGDSYSIGLRRMPKNLPVWIVYIRKGPSNTQFEGELHILANAHAVFGPAGSILLDTLASATPSSALTQVDRPNTPAKPAPVSSVPQFSFGSAALPTGKENIPSSNEDFEQEVLTLVNAERKKRKLPALGWNGNLARAARYHAADMASKGYFDHDSMARRVDSPRSPLRKIATCQERLQLFDPTGAGENIAKGQPTPATVMKSWMSSSGHRANILRKESKTIGVGFVASHWVQNFSR